MDVRGEVEAAQLGDKRLTARLVRLAEQLARAPEQSFPKAAGSDAALEATYRFLGNEAVEPDAILRPHLVATTERCKAARTVLVAHDTTEFRFSSEREGLGRVAGNLTHGFLGHFALAISAARRAPLGVVVSAARSPSGGFEVTAADSARGRDLPASFDLGEPISPAPATPARVSAAAAGR